MKPNLQCPLIDTVRTAFIGRRIVFGGSNATKHTAFRYLIIVVLCEALETQYWQSSQCLSAQIYCVIFLLSKYLALGDPNHRVDENRDSLVVD